MPSFFAFVNYKKYGEYNGIENENALAGIGTIGLIFSCLSFTCSFLLDFFSYKNIYAVLLII